MAVETIPVDLAGSSDEQLSAIAATVTSLCGGTPLSEHAELDLVPSDEGVDVLFNCAGVGYRGTALDTSMEVSISHSESRDFPRTLPLTS